MRDTCIGIYAIHAYNAGSGSELWGRGPGRPHLPAHAQPQRGRGRKPYSGSSPWAAEITRPCAADCWLQQVRSSLAGCLQLMALVILISHIENLAIRQYYHHSYEIYIVISLGTTIYHITTLF